MQIGEEGRNNPGLVDMSAHGSGALKSPKSLVQGIAREGSKNSKSNTLCLGVWMIQGPQGLFPGYFPSQFGSSHNHRAMARAKLQGRVACPLGSFHIILGELWVTLPRPAPGSLNLQMGQQDPHGAEEIEMREE